jgi:hypothetical protein
MPGQQFQILPIMDKASNKKLRYIQHKESGLKIVVYPLQTNPGFTPDENELCFYGRLFQWWHAFETTGFQEHQLELISPALEWFANMSLYPQMRPQLTDPRLEAAAAMINTGKLLN